MNTDVQQNPYIRQAQVACSDPDQAVRQLSQALQQDNMAGVIFFCSSEYDFEALSQALKTHFDCPVAGCTSAGEIGSSYQQGGIVGMSFSAERFCFHPVSIDKINEFDISTASNMAKHLEAQLRFSNTFRKKSMFGLLLIDGLSRWEEQVIATLDTAMHNIAIAGGSAGDNLKFNQTHVYANHRFQTEAAVFILVESKLAFHAFKLHHFEATEKDVVITHADPQSRTVYEIDGGPAAEEYAAALGTEVASVTNALYFEHPLMLQIGKEWYVRAAMQANDDQSLSFFCAIDEGLPLNIGKRGSIINTLKAKVSELKNKFSGGIICTLGFDCACRKVELAETGQTAEVEQLLREINFLGFSTFGEQLNGVHMNQTLVGIVIGED